MVTPTPAPADNCQRRADKLAGPMFALSLLYVLLLAALIVVWVDIPRVAELAAAASNETADIRSLPPLGYKTIDAGFIRYQSLLLLSDELGSAIFTLLMLIWPLFWLEYWSASVSSKKLRQFSKGKQLRTVACFFPPLRLATMSPARGGCIWLPWLGWQSPGRRLFRLLEQAFNKRMLVIALLILPVLAIEFGLNKLVLEQTWLRIVLHLATGFIWCAFTVEFMIMINVTDRKLDYIQKNWVDVAIILLPMISFMRSCRLLRVDRIADLQSFVRLGRIYQMRGLLMKVFRALLLYDFIGRLVGFTQSSRLLKLKQEYAEKLNALEKLKYDISRTEFEIAALEQQSSS